MVIIQSYVAEEFVAAIKAEVHDSAVAEVLADVQAPSGRKPPDSLLQLSSWYNALPESDRAHVETMVLHGVHAALFGLLAVIDGVRVIEDDREKSQFTLVQKRGTAQHEINSPSVLLHDIYQSEVWDEVFGGARRP